MVDYIRSASLTGYVDLARSVGLSPYRMIEAAGLPRMCLADPDSKIPLGALIRLLDESAKASGVEDFGLRMAEQRPFSAMGALGLVIREQPTLRAALQAMERFVHLTTNSLYLSIQESDGIAVVTFGIGACHRAGARQAMELTLGNLHRVLRSLMRNDWRARTVCFSHAPPSDLRSHRRIFFGAPVEFGHDFDGFVIARADLDAPLPHADPVIARQMERYAEHLGGRPGASPLERVRERILAMLPTGACTAEHVAQYLGVDRRTLHRWLASESTTFSDLTQTVRTEYVAHYLDNERRSMAEIAELLGFSAQSAFTRWFRATFDCTPTAWRQRQRVALSERRHAPVAMFGVG